ncbi:penicillin-binding protein 2 [Halobacillus shinanisalinarum]|uniref:serine-type D-Ala-D-Ala carboxypeptidase n=1 Tax=Halobacillus shinanisalinarum TaxID=2932258 RepID=A0ABY4GZZ7_9BACI|nr:penicillin-binding protein 2 [Halobacillus shinanisalinarum]UOQ93748.1 penicillin-binding protein 2 [Halobacillus shinanisalinarum]
MGKKKKKSHVPFRLNIIFFVVFLLFAALILQLGVVQILTGEAAQDKVNRTENTTTTIPVPRGEMYDRYGRLVVNNEPLYSITYTPPKGVQSKDKLELAKQLAKYIDMEFKDVLSTRDLKEYFFLENEEEIRERVTEKEAEGLDNGEVYQLQLDSIKEEEVTSYDDLTKEIIAIKKELDKAYALAPHVIKNEDISQKEYSTVAEHLSELPGINVTSDWEREYPFGNTFKNYMGDITSREQGVPREELEYYMSLDYSRNDRVGTSGLEQQYEEVLRGTKEKVQYTTDSSNNIIDSKVVRQGSRGKDLVLTIDMELQRKVDKIVKEELVSAVQQAPYENRFLENAIVVMSDPMTGEVLAVSGQHYNHDRESGEELVSDWSHAAVYNAYAPGSTVKGATVLTGFNEGIITPSTVVNDRTIKIKGTPEKSSYATLGPVNYLSALKESSNVYMFFIAIWMGGAHYERNEPLDLANDTFQRFLYNFQQFGLGVETGIDLPFEATGFKGDNPASGNILDFAIGQYSTYTAMQLNQYVSTIANGGQRIKPRLVSEIHNPSRVGEGLGEIYKEYDPTVLNTLEMSEENIERVQRGFREVFTGGSPAGTAYSHFRNVDYMPAGKSGTAETAKYIPINGGEDTKVIDTENLSLIGYAPYNNPEVAFSVMVPYVGNKADTPINYEIGRRIMDAYFELKEQRAEEGVDKDLLSNEED